MTREQKLRSILMQDIIITNEFYITFYDGFYDILQNPNKELDGLEIIDFRTEVAQYFNINPISGSWSREYEDKLCSFENAIRCQMTLNDAKNIEESWSAFAENPSDYINDKVIDLIVDDLKLNNVKERRKNMRDFSDVLNPVKELDKMKYMVDGSLAYGKWNDKTVYVRRLANVPEAYGIGMNSNSKPFSQSVNGYTGLGDPLVTMWYTADEHSNERGTVVFVFRLSDAKGLNINEFLVEPVDYNYYGTYLLDAQRGVDYELYNTLAHIYVPFSDGSKGSKIPVMWRNDLDSKYFQDNRLPWRGTISFDDYTGGDDVLFNEEKSSELIQLISRTLPAVDLETEPERRYAYIETKLDHDLNTVNVPIFVYNKNHVAHHGAVASKEKVSPILFLLMTEWASSIYKESLVDYCMRYFKETDNIVIKRKGVNMVQDESVAMQEGYINNPTTSKVPEDKLYEDNILLRAAKASDARYK